MDIFGNNFRSMGVIGLSLFQVRNVADLKAEIRDLRLQRTLLKEEVFRLTKRGKPATKKKKKLEEKTSKKIS